MKTFIVYLRHKEDLTNVYSEGKTSLEALSTLYRRFPEAEFVKIECVTNPQKVKKIYRNTICQINHVKDHIKK
jgi:hypothetical protein